MSSAKYNLNNPAVKRILQEVKEMQNNPSDDYMSLPLEENIFEWQFAIRGPRDSEFEGGIYHGRIQLPPEYPFKPPAFMLLTPNGRFETQTKICLSISQYHPEHWQPSWSVRTALVALIAFMPTKGNGAIGSLEFPKEERKALALKSVEAPPKYGNAERQKLIDQIHEEMVKRSCASATVVEKISSSPDCDEKSAETTQDEKLVAAGDAASSEPVSVDSASSETVSGGAASTEPQVSEQQVNAPEPARETMIVAPAQVRAATRQPASDDHFLTLIAIGLVVALAALMIRKFYSSFSWIGFNK